MLFVQLLFEPESTFFPGAFMAQLRLHFLSASAALLINIFFLAGLPVGSHGADVVACRLDDPIDVKSRQVEEKGVYRFNFLYPNISSAYRFVTKLIYIHLVTVQCGLANQASRIVTGSIAQPNEFPWMAHLTIYFWSGDAATCGGTVIGDRWVLTAAHCTYGAVNITVTLGAHDVSVNSPDTHKQVFSVPPRSWITHPLWRYGDVEDDIAILELPQAAVLNSKITFISSIYNLVNRILIQVFYYKINKIT